MKLGGIQILHTEFRSFSAIKWKLEKMSSYVNTLCCVNVWRRYYKLMIKLIPIEYHDMTS